eukprot:86119-Amphidinium_carterae.1
MYLGSLEEPVDKPPGLQDEEVVEVHDFNAAMAVDGTFEQTFANQEAAKEDNQVKRKKEQPTAEYDGGNFDAKSISGSTRTHDVLNQDKYGFGLEQDIDDDDIRLFDEEGLQPDGFEMIS